MSSFPSPCHLLSPAQYLLLSSLFLFLSNVILSLLVFFLSTGPLLLSLCDLPPPAPCPTSQSLFTLLPPTPNLLLPPTFLLQPAPCLPPCLLPSPVQCPLSPYLCPLLQSVPYQ